jgi:hypothetical protein
MEKEEILRKMKPLITESEYLSLDMFLSNYSNRFFGLIKRKTFVIEPRQYESRNWYYKIRKDEYSDTYIRIG